MISIAARVALLLALACAAGCASRLPVGTSYDPLALFPPEATWRWDERHNRLPEEGRIAALDLGPPLREAVTEELASRGYTPAGAELPDYLISYQLTTNTRIRPEGSIVVASLSLLVSEADSGQLGRRVWSAFAQAEVDVALDPTERRQRVRDAVAALLLDFPPRR